MVARRAHNPEVVGSSPASATRKEKVIPIGMAFFFSQLAKQALADLRVPGGERGERRQWREERPERVAAVGAPRSRTVGKAHTGHRNRVDTQNGFLGGLELNLKLILVKK